MTRDSLRAVIAGGVQLDRRPHQPNGADMADIIRRALHDDPEDHQ